MCDFCLSALLLESQLCGDHLWEGSYCFWNANTWNHLLETLKIGECRVWKPSRRFRLLQRFRVLESQLSGGQLVKIWVYGLALSRRGLFRLSILGLVCGGP